ncbi:GNAT family N-acetyltransferase [Erythrobacter sp. WG]|uniref:GNAT family N-acetyltransferase n=1 Tax=Erythrobacter sp. WG TaxID=2985510 RepID=UPI00226D9C2F|nr:GNAT family N-acetyltransferase [Erythrobacter sp. WG]MCX9146849.1 GNAT family N-acetyltransferase [Erythrobacter sp. WG]
MTATVLTTARLILRQIGEDDLDPHMALLNTPAVMRHLGGVQPREVIAAKHAASRASFAAQGFGFMLMVERSSGEIVGHCGLRHVAHPLAPNPQDHEIGWVVREDRWRRGYAHEAMRAVVDWGFAVHGVPLLVALTLEANVGSWRLMEKLGMTRRPDLDFTDPAMPPEANPTIQYALEWARWEALR